MKINNLVIEDLYEGAISYDIKFNDDLTILYGDNGAGKTTVLEILTILISGNIIALLKYNFKSITLIYKDKDTDLLNELKVICEKDDILRVNFKGESLLVKGNEFSNRTNNPRSDYSALTKKIKKTFNMVFLPLTRNNKSKRFSNSFSRETRYYGENRNRAAHGLIEENPKHNEPISLVEQLVERKTSRMMYEVEKLNQEFKNNIFKSLFRFDFEGTPFYTNTNREEFKERKDKLVKIVKDIGLENPEYLYDKINELYSEFKVVEKKVYPQNGEEPDIESVKLFMANSSRLKILDEVILLAEENNKNKERVTYPISKFEDTINSYFSGGTFSKKIFIEKGEIFFCMNDSPNRLGINKLSSGEQQLVIFFIHLIFGLDANEEGIYIVDEPEISLHLSWQRKLINSITDINNNLQLIFATHSPEIIGPHRDSTFKLNNIKI